MKKIKFEGKLSLNKETVTKLNQDHMSAIQGGVEGTILTTLRNCLPRPTDKTDTCGLTDGVTCECAPNNTRYCPVNV